MSKQSIEFEIPKKPIILIAVSLVAVSIFLAVTIWASVLYFEGTLSNALNQKQSLFESSELSALQAYEVKLLNSVEWVDRSKKTVSVPIDVAIDQVLSDYRQ